MMKILRRFGDLGISGAMARWYDKNSRGPRIEELRGYAKEAAKLAGDGAAVLEVAPGPGVLAIELAKLGTYKITGLDISKDFVRIAQTNAKNAGVEIDFRQGNVDNMPFPHETFDSIICTAAFKNFKQPLEALGEMHRVLKPGGTALIIDMNGNATNKKLDDCISGISSRWLEKLFLTFVFRFFLMKGAYTKGEFTALILKTSFKKYRVDEIGIGLNVYLYK